MKTFLQKLHLSNFKNAIFRFPIASFFAIFATSILLCNIWIRSDFWTGELLFRLMSTSVLIFFLSVGVKLLSEAGKWHKFVSISAQILILAFDGFFFYSVRGIDFGALVFFLSMLVAIVSFLFFAPHMRRLFSPIDSSKLYYSYFLEIFFTIVSSMFFSGLLFILGFVAIASVFSLFSLSDIFGYSLSGKIYATWATFSLLTFSGFFGLSKLPTSDDFYRLYEYKKQIWHFAIQYLFLPFTIIYFIILYAYSIFVLAHFGDWPRGIISWLVICFSILGYFTYILSYPLQEKYTLIEKFRKIFPFVVIPQLGMLFYAIYLRINQFDLTINRYIVVLFGVWLLIVSLYLIFSRRKFLAYIPFFLTTIVLIFSVGSWSIYNLPADRQLDRLKVNLTKAKMLENGKIIPPESTKNIDNNLLIEIYNGVTYLCDTYDCLPMKDLFPEIVKENQKDSRNGKWHSRSQITKLLKVSYGGHINHEGISYVSLFNSQKYDTLDIGKYSKILRRQYDKVSRKNTFFIDIETQKLRVFDAEGNEESVDMSPTFKKFIAVIDQKQGGK